MRFNNINWTLPASSQKKYVKVEDLTTLKDGDEVIFVLYNNRDSASGLELCIATNKIASGRMYGSAYTFPLNTTELTIEEVADVSTAWADSKTPAAAQTQYFTLHKSVIDNIPYYSFVDVDNNKILTGGTTVSDLSLATYNPSNITNHQLFIFDQQYVVSPQLLYYNDETQRITYIPDKYISGTSWGGIAINFGGSASKGYWTAITGKKNIQTATPIYYFYIFKKS